ncbi:NADH dehydrogenase subunit 4 [Iris pallida]|uniref:NADH dehydrogenase subunit 4 (Mitochondrion) n=1 Tax=Iris pallida TaxID=29817 RepID=A0AAX6FFF5_IRIPA|nr:NADH dehydrogenase subunit 4 [Iris pallida]
MVGKPVYEVKPIATPTIKYEIGPLLKSLMDPEGSRTRCIPFVRIANIPCTIRRRASLADRAGRRCQILKSSLDQPSAPTTWYDEHSKTWRMMAHTTQERLYMGTHGWKQSLFF